MEFIKKYKFWIVGIVVVLILGLLIYGMCSLLLPNSSKDLYGNRLDGMEEVMIQNSTISKIKEEIAALNEVNSIEYHLSGRIANFLIDVKKDTDLISAHGLADKLLPYFEDNQKEYFDIQVLITCKEDTESTIYPMAGYKHKTSVGFKWNYNE